MKYIILFTIKIILSSEFERDPWLVMDEGFSLGHFYPVNKAQVGDSKITVIKIDPTYYNINLYSASEYEHGSLTISEWAYQYELLVAINAGMFQTDHISNVGYMKNFNHFNNKRINHYQSVAAFNPIKTEEPEFRIFDMDEFDMDIINRDYQTVIQNLRLIKRPKENRWSQQDKIWSEAALGEDKDGNILFIFSRSPYSMHDFNNILINLSIDIQCAQHLEGGPPASLYLNAKENKLEYLGSYESKFFEDDENINSWNLPNIIGIRKKGEK